MNRLTEIKQINEENSVTKNSYSNSQTVKMNYKQKE